MPKRSSRRIWTARFPYLDSRGNAAYRPAISHAHSRIQWDPSTSVALTSAYRERHAAFAEAAILVAGGGLGLWLFRSESFHACVYETFWNESLGMATPPPGITRATSILPNGPWVAHRSSARDRAELANESSRGCGASRLSLFRRALFHLFQRFRSRLIRCRLVLP
jgi:hypothetical protein